MRALRLPLFLLFIVTVGCASHAPIQPGTVPEEHAISSEDELYGQKVLGELSRKYPLDRDDAHVNRVRDIVDKLTTKGLGSKNPWHVYVLSSKTFKNAAATRGNYVIVWSGLLDTLKSDDELATVLAHELGHLLAGHTNANPMDEASQILSGATSGIANAVLGAYGIPSGVGDIVGEVVSATFQAMIMNPGQRSKELEADLIGMFLMAKAGIDPQAAVDFWTRVKLDPDFSNDKFTFLTNHPSSKDRLKQLEKYLPQAEDVYHGKTSAMPVVLTPSGKIDPSGGFAIDPTKKTPPTSELETKVSRKSKKHGEDDPGAWVAEEDNCKVYAEPREDATVLATLPRGTKVTISQDLRTWLQIEAPQRGYVHSVEFSPP